MKKLLSLLLVILMVMAIFTGCSAKTNNETGSLDGKKIIFIGNSFTHYGNA